MMKMVRFDFFLPEEMLNKLKEKERETGNSVSSAIREYISRGLEKESGNGGSPANRVPPDKR